jgi:hypothetical protein
MGAIVRTALLVMLVALSATGCGLFPKAPQACLGGAGIADRGVAVRVPAGM